MANIQIRRSNKFIKSMVQFKVTESEYDAFVTLKTSNPLAKFGSVDYKYKGGDLAKTGCSHAHIRTDLILVYKLEGSNPHILTLYCFTNHEESGTGTPSKLKKQKEFAKKLNNMSFGNDTDNLDAI